MDLLKTTILPTDDADLAKRIWQNLVHEQAKVLLVVQGKGQAAETFVQRADRLAGSPTDPRGVIWVREPSLIQSEIDLLQGNQPLLDELGTAQGFSLSLSDTVRDVISADEPAPPKLSRIFRAFAKAERD